jgi:hypothetical protein
MDRVAEPPIVALAAFGVFQEKVRGRSKRV